MEEKPVKKKSAKKRLEELLGRKPTKDTALDRLKLESKSNSFYFCPACGKEARTGIFPDCKCLENPVLKTE